MFSQYNWIQPASRRNIESLWSQPMLTGALIARFTTGMTTGSRVAAVMAQISAISKRPCEEVAVTVRAPADAAPKHALWALCSDSTRISSVSTTPSWT